MKRKLLKNPLNERLYLCVFQIYNSLFKKSKFQSYFRFYCGLYNNITYSDDRFNEYTGFI